MASQPQKLAYVDGKLGAPITGQQTTRILFNTITAPGTTSSLIFFKNFQGLSPGQTHLNQNKLDSMESQIIKVIYLSQLSSGSVQQVFGGLVGQTISIIVGNQTVVKNLPINFNQGTNGQAFDRLHENAGAVSDLSFAATNVRQTVQPIEIRLLTDIVIPPQVAFEVRVDSNSGVYGAGSVVCALAGYGKIFSAGNSF